MKFFAWMKAIFSMPPKSGRPRYMKARDYMFLDNNIHLLDDHGKALKDGGNDYSRAMSKIAESLYAAAPCIGDAGIDQAIGWLNKARNPDYIRKNEFGVVLHDLRVTEEQVDRMLHYCRMRIPELNRQLAENDSWHAGAERQSLVDLQCKLQPLESDISKKEWSYVREAMKV